MTEVDERPHRSVSQLNQYERCPYAYKLSRIDKVWQRPAAWTAQGSAVHEAIEAWELSGREMSLEGMQAEFLKSYQKHVNAACAETPNFEWWFASGPYRGRQDIARRLEIGLEQCGRYIDWARNHTEEKILVLADGTPAIELPFDIELGGVKVRGYIDAVIWVQTGPEQWELRVRDHKTGRQPDDDFQLGVYKVAMKVQYGVDTPSGDYWMGKSGKATYPYKLDRWTVESVTAKFQELDANVNAGKFEARPDSTTCRFCDVAYDCPFVVS
ncbi:putative RecB-like exonuclease [Mycobacterium phage PP]|uniref:Putative RecB-like exonuclease n=1 Tax=Mycobacterium phage PP TaxID=2077134 RepID=A0A2Z5XVI2_9CAUD|nr:exonuclease [Mycobacterium phage PP]BBC53864.1 putative RecB-like exonuclease [Mycobacterium phage PP]